MTLEDRLEQLANRTPPGDTAEILAVARARAEARNRRPSGGPRLLIAAAAVVAVAAVAAGVFTVLSDDGGRADVAAGRDRSTSAAPASDRREHGDATPWVSVEALGLPAVAIATSPLSPSGAEHPDAWLTHVVTLENTGPDPLHLDDFRSGTVLGDREVLAATEGCGHGDALTQPAVPACRHDHRSVTIEPGESHSFTVTLWRDLPGMNPVTTGTYRWDIEIRMGPRPFPDPRVPGGEAGTITLRYGGLTDGSDAGPTDLEPFTMRYRIVQGAGAVLFEAEWRLDFTSFEEWTMELLSTTDAAGGMEPGARRSVHDGTMTQTFGPSGTGLSDPVDGPVAPLHLFSRGPLPDEDLTELFGQPAERAVLDGRHGYRSVRVQDCPDGRGRHLPGCDDTGDDVTVVEFHEFNRDGVPVFSRSYVERTGKTIWEFEVLEYQRKR